MGGGGENIWKFRKNVILPAIIFVVGNIFFILLWQALLQQEHHKIQKETQDEARYIENIFHIKMNDHILSLKRMRARLTQEFNPRLWKEDAKNYLRDNPSLTALAIKNQNGKWIGSVYQSNFVGSSTSNINFYFEKCSEQIEKSSSGNILISYAKQHKICAAFKTIHNKKQILLFAMIDVFQLMDETVKENLDAGYGAKLLYENQIVYFRDNHSPQLIDAWNYKLPIQIESVSLQLIIWPSESIVNKYSWFSHISLLTGIIITLLLSLMTRQLQISRFIHIKFKSLLEGSPDAMVIVDRKGKITMINNQTEKLFGYLRNELLGKDMEMLMPERYRAKHQSHHRTSYFLNPRARSMGSGLELYGIRKNNQEFPVEISLSPVETEEGILALAAIRDVTIRRKIEESQAMLSSIVESSNDAVIGKDLEGNITSWNKAAEELYGFTAGEIIGKNINLIIPKSHQDESSMIMNKISSGLPIRYFETERFNKNGCTIPVSVTISPIKDLSGNIIGASTIARDISKQKQIEKMKNEFISVVSHELRTPLTSIHGAVALLSNDFLKKSPSDLTELLEVAQYNTERLIRLVNDILDIEKIEAGEMKFNLEPVEINQLVEESIAANKTYGEKFSVKIHLVKPVPAIKVFVDRDRLLQVLNNLISNAVKFSPVNEDITIALYIHQKDKIRTEVSDHGKGIPEEFRSRIFQKFAQADSTSTRERGGTGLGLSVSKAIIEKLSGTINFKSELNKGTTFYFDLPIYSDETGINSCKN